MSRLSILCRAKCLILLIVVILLFAVVKKLTFTTRENTNIRIWENFPFYDKYLLQQNNNQTYHSLKYDFRLIKGNKSLDDSRVKVRQNTCKGCFPHDYDMLLDNKNICTSNAGERIIVILMIPSAPDRKLQREAIRSTWTTYTRNNTANVRYAFVMGLSNNAYMNKQVYSEHILFKDILQENFVDSYRNLTVKTVMALKWASKNCQNVAHFMKIDDDVYLNIPGLLSVLDGSVGQRLATAVGGACQKTSSPTRDKYSKFFISKEMYPKNIYPEYCAGPGYVMSMNVALNIYQISRNVPYFPFEDVYVALTVKILGFRLINIAGFHGTLPKFDTCSYKHKDFVMTHGVSITLMKKFWSATCI